MASSGQYQSLINTQLRIYFNTFIVAAANVFNSNNPRDDLPLYDDIVKMNVLPSSPLLEERFSSSIFSTATSVQFEWNGGYDLGITQ